jgi:hypothetical protein
MARVIQGWNVNQLVDASDMQDLTGTQQIESGAGQQANLPCIYNGLVPVQSGTGGSIVTFSDGVARCQDLLVSTYTYLPVNPYGPGYPCYIEIDAASTNNSITLGTGNATAYIVATFTISPTTSGQTQYTITGSLAQIATSAYNPAIHVKLCAFSYAASVWTLDIGVFSNRNNDLTGLAALQWSYQSNSLNIGIPQSQSGNTLNINAAFTNITTGVGSTLSVQGNEVIYNGSSLTFYNSANTQFSSFHSANTSNANYVLPVALPPGGVSYPPLVSDTSGNMTWGPNIALLGYLSIINPLTAFYSRFISANTSNATYVLPVALPPTPNVHTPLTSDSSGNLNWDNNINLHSQGALAFYNTANSFYTAFYSVASSSVNYALPATSPINIHAPLTSDASGNLNWDSNINLYSQGALSFFNSANSFYTAFTSANTSNATYVLPVGLPSVSGLALVCNTSGNMSWSTLTISAANVIGSTTGTAPAAGYLGEYQYARSSGVTINTTVTPIASIPLTAGVWSVTGIGSFPTLGGSGGGPLLIEMAVFTSMTFTGPINGDNYLEGNTSVTNSIINLTISDWEFTTSSSQTLYLFARYSGGSSAQCNGRISARRVA